MYENVYTHPFFQILERKGEKSHQKVIIEELLKIELIFFIRKFKLYKEKI